MSNDIFEKLYFTTRSEWLELRGAGIGGSDAAAIIGFNPYKTNLELWREKTGLVKSESIENAFTIYGTDAEAPIRDLLKLDYKGLLDITHEDCLYVRKDKPHIRGTLDGCAEVLENFKFLSFWKAYLTENKMVPDSIVFEKDMKIVIEIKTTEVLAAMHKEKWKNKMPNNYYAQVIHYLMVTGYDGFILRVKLKFEDNNGVITHEFRDYGILRSQVLTDIEYLEKKVDAFWVHVTNKIEPALVINI